MSLLFSEVTIKDKNGGRTTLRESGLPDKYDMLELLQYGDRYAPFRKAGLHGALIRVQGYRFQAKGPEWLAEGDHFALMDAYDALARRHGEKPFIRRRDVKRLERFSFELRAAPEGNGAVMQETFQKRSGLTAKHGPDLEGEV